MKNADNNKQPKLTACQPQIAKNKPKAEPAAVPKS
jgi:hypothetical protein